MIFSDLYETWKIYFTLNLIITFQFQSSVTVVQYVKDYVSHRRNPYE